MPRLRPSHRRQRPRGVFLSIEGVDGSGKSTQIGLLIRALRRSGRKVVSLREPGGTAIGEKIRHLLQYDRNARRMDAAAETLLFCASRAQLVAEKILPALRAGRVVVCDRFYDSTTVYQGYGRGLSVADIRRIHRFSTGACRPDLTLVLLMDTGRSLRRARKSSGRYDRMERQNRSFYESIYRGYRRLARSEPRRVRCIRADRPIGEVHAEIWKRVCAKLGGRGR